MINSQINLTNKDLSLYSKMGSRAVFGKIVTDLAPNHDKLLILTADTSTSAGLDRFRKLYSEKHVEIGIAEQNGMGIASALALEGWNVVFTTFTPFLILRALEQIKVNLSYMSSPVKLVGLAGGIVLGDLGYTHCAIEDIAICRSIPNISILSPSDICEVIKCTEYLLSHDGPIYMRLSGPQTQRIINPPEYNFKFGKAVKIKSGSKVAILATGQGLHIALDVFDILQDKGISCSVINHHTIVPIDVESILNAMSSHELMVTIEEHSIVGGLGTQVAEIFAENGVLKATKLRKFGLNHSYGKSGSYIDLMERSGLEKEAIADSILKILNR